MLKKIGLVLAVCLVVFVAVVFTRPDSFRVERSIEIAAPTTVVFPLLNDFHKWSKWSPWEKLDSNMQRIFEGSPAGVGAIYSWTGNDKVGAGRMSIVNSRLDQQVEIKLEFLKPMRATNTTLFTLTPNGTSTKLSWVMSGHNDFIGKAFCMFMDMDRMVGGDFEKGLAAIKSLAESPAAQPMK